tara:strand:+ start:8797 stop:9561 length:765 start_codon:yes stop_codon:yes gene_type:complete
MVTLEAPEINNQAVDLWRRPSLKWLSTNEDLESILEGMDVNEDDSILAIGGSGEQIFAMLSRGAKVTVIDYDPVQIWYIKYRAKLIENGFIDTFLEPITTYWQNFRPNPLDFFRKQGILDSIRENVGNLTIMEPTDLYDLDPTPIERFNKLYLSNAIQSDKKRAESIQLLKGFVKYLPLGGLIYSSQRIDEVLDLQKNGILGFFVDLGSMVKRRIMGNDNDRNLMVEDMELSGRARSSYSSMIIWDRTVYRKVA